MSTVASVQPTTQSDFAIVALLDALGTKGLLSRAAPDGLLNTWQSLLHELEGWCADATAAEVCESCTFLAFSDTILITIIPVHEGSQPECLSLMHGLLQRFVWNGFMEGVYFRGALSCGRFIQSPSKMLGESLEEAAEWYEQADWMGVLATPTAGHLIEQMLLDGWILDDLFVRYTVPLRNLVQYDTWVVNWPAFAEEDATAKGQVAAKNLLLRSFRTYSGPISPAIAAKYGNTLAFADRVWGSPTGDRTE